MLIFQKHVMQKLIQNYFNQFLLKTIVKVYTSSKETLSDKCISLEMLVAVNSTSLTTKLPMKCLSSSQIS